MSSGELEQARSVLRLKAFERVQGFRHRAVEKDPDFGDGSGLITSLRLWGWGKTLNSGLWRSGASRLLTFRV